jgi:hypothetical protein
MERESQIKRSYESQGVLGHLYRDISTKEALIQFIRNEYDNSVQCLYELDQNILNMCDKSVMHKYLKICYQNIVQPMSFVFKKIMYYF